MRYIPPFVQGVHDCASYVKLLLPAGYHILSDMAYRGVFIDIEGGDGSGKSTQIALLKERLPALYPGKEFLFTREPGGTPFAEEIRSAILSNGAKDTNATTLLDLFMASRFEHVEHAIAPALKKGAAVISSRFVASTYAYQIAGEEHAELLPLYKAHMELLSHQPDLIIVLDIDPAEGLKRLAGRKGEASDHLEARTLAFHTRVRAGYKEFEKLFKLKKMVFIDASRSIEEVYEAILAVLKPALM